MYPTSLGAPKRRYPSLALMSSRQLAENGDIHCWYAEMQQCFESHGMSINALPFFQHSLDSPTLFQCTFLRINAKYTAAYPFLFAYQEYAQLSQGLSLRMQSSAPVLEHSECSFSSLPAAYYLHTVRE